MTNTNTEKGAKNATASTPNADAFDRKEFSRLFARVKAECTTIVYDADKKRPLFSPSTDAAVAKRDAVMQALASFIEQVDNAKRES